MLHCPLKRNQSDVPAKSASFKPNGIQALYWNDSSNTEKWTKCGCFMTSCPSISLPQVWRAALKSFTGHKWPPGRRLPIPDLQTEMVVPPTACPAFMLANGCSLPAGLAAFDHQNTRVTNVVFISSPSDPYASGASSAGQR